MMGSCIIRDSERQRSCLRKSFLVSGIIHSLLLGWVYLLGKNLHDIDNRQNEKTIEMILIEPSKCLQEQVISRNPIQPKKIVKQFSKQISSSINQERMSGGIKSQSVVAVYTPEPVYPQLAQEEGIEGTITVQLTISPKGEVCSAEILAPRGPKILEEAALRAVRTWKYESRESSTNLVYEKKITFKLT